MDYKKTLEELMEIVVKEKASDIHISEGRVPVVRSSGSLLSLPNYKPFDRTDMNGYLEALLSAPAKEMFKQNMEADFAYAYKDQGRFRGNVFMQRGAICIALRLIPTHIRTLEELNLPPILESFTSKSQGFFLVVGPTGQGKSTTLAAMLDLVNKNRLEHIITIEDPIEYVYTQQKSIIDQREVRIDTPDFHTALRGSFRQDVNVLMIGEMREPETISTAVTAAETGHLVFSTLHTNTAAQTIERIIDTFPADQQNQIRLQLASSLIGIFSQRLIPRVSGGLIPAYELLIANGAVQNLIRENRTYEINSIIETSSEEGMIDLNRCLASLVRAGEIKAEDAFVHATNPEALERLL